VPNGCAAVFDGLEFNDLKGGVVYAMGPGDRDAVNMFSGKLVYVRNDLACEQFKHSLADLTARLNRRPDNVTAPKGCQISAD
jgi:hypothetical protein